MENNEHNEINEFGELKWKDVDSYPEGYWDSSKKEESFEEFFEKKKSEEIRKDELFGYGNKVPESISWEELDSEVFPEQSWRINKLIPKEGFVILASISGNKKTWISLDFARSIVEGVNFLGDENFKTEGANVLYIDGESPKSELQRRCRQLNFKSNTPHRLHIIKEDILNLDKDEADVWLRAFIEFYKIKVVFIDTFISVSGGIKEDKAEDIRQFFNKFNSLKNKGVVVVWLMHLRKPNYFEGKAPKKEQVLGSQDKIASVEVLLMIHSESGSDEINVYQRKNRLGKEGEPFKILMKDSIDELGKTKTVLEYGGPIEESENKKDQAKEMILDVLEGGEGKTTKEIQTITSKQVGSKNTKLALKELVKDGSLKLEKKGKSDFYIFQQESEQLLDIGDLDNKKDVLF